MKGSSVIEAGLEVARLVAALERQGIGRVVLLGTAEQMTSPAIRKPLAASGILVLVPPAQARGRIEALCNEQSPDAAWLKDMLEDGIEHGAEAIVVAHAPLVSLLRSLHLSVPLVCGDLL